MASTRLAAVLSAARGVSCADAPGTAAAVPPTPVDAIGRDRARPAIPAGATIETQVDVAHAGAGARSGRRTAARRGPRCRPAGGRLAAVPARPGAPRCGARSGPSMPACRAVRSPRPPDQAAGLSLERRSGGVSRGRRRLHRPVKGVIDAPNSAHVARHQRLDVPLPACLDRSGGPSSRSSAGPRRRSGTPGHPPGTPAQFPAPRSRGGTHRYPRPCVLGISQKGEARNDGEGTPGESEI